MVTNKKRRMRRRASHQWPTWLSVPEWVVKWEVARGGHHWIISNRVGKGDPSTPQSSISAASRVSRCVKDIAARRTTNNTQTVSYPALVLNFTGNHQWSLYTEKVPCIHLDRHTTSKAFLLLLLLSVSLSVSLSTYLPHNPTWVLCIMQRSCIAINRHHSKYHHFFVLKWTSFFTTFQYAF